MCANLQIFYFGQIIKDYNGFDMMLEHVLHVRRRLLCSLRKTQNVSVHSCDL